MTDVSAIFFSCRRLHLLRQTIWSFIQSNTYPIAEYIIVNDSADEKIHDELRATYEGFRFVFNEKNIGLIASVDEGYKHIQTEYFFHDEDDWAFDGRGGFIEESLEVMQHDPMIEEVWLMDMNSHPVEPKIYQANEVKYQLLQDNYQKGQNGYNDLGWHGFTTACALKRLSDYRKVGPYAPIPWQGTIWHREQAIGEKYHELGYRSAVLSSGLAQSYVHNIGYGQSEYKTGYEL